MPHKVKRSDACIFEKEHTSMCMTHLEFACSMVAFLALYIFVLMNVSLVVNLFYSLFELL